MSPHRPAPGASFPPTTGPFARGFTLLELLVVIMIIGIIVSFAGLSIGQHASRTLQEEAERLYSLVRLAGEESVLQGQELGLQFGRKDYHFVTLAGADWVPVEGDKLLRAREVPPGVDLALRLEGVEASFDDPENPPRIFIFSSGEMIPFELTLRNLEGESYTLRGDLDGKLALAHESDGDATF